VDLSPQAVEFGSAMREMRIAHGRELADVAETLRIRQAFLQAIEDGRFHDLPGPAYAGGFVRAYADYLGLDVPEVMRRYREASGPDGAGAQSALVPPSPMAEGRMPTGFILLVAVILGALVYGGWYYLTLHGRDAGEVVGDLPRQLAEMVGIRTGTEPTEPAVVAPPTEPESAPGGPNPAEPPAPATAEKAAPKPVPRPPPAPAPAPVAAAPVPDPAPAPVRTAPNPPAKPAPPPVVEMPAPAAEPTPVVRAARATAPEPAVQPVPEPAARPAPEPEVRPAPEPAPEAVPQAAPEPTVAPSVAEAAPPAEAPAPVPAAPAPSRMAAATDASGAAGRVVLRATSASWVELRDTDNRRVFSQVMRAGETYAVPAGRPIMLTTGNAGGLDILIDGRPIPSLGPVGDVRRNISLEPEALLSRLQR